MILDLAQKGRSFEDDSFDSAWGDVITLVLFYFILNNNLIAIKIENEIFEP